MAWLLKRLPSTLGPEFEWKSVSVIKHTFWVRLVILTQELAMIFHVDCEFNTPGAVGPLF